MNIQANREFRDPVHGLIKLTDQEVNIIDQLPFQRLRRIKQLAMAHLVYPGALHTRFDHSLGTLHAAGQIVRNVAIAEQLSYDDVISIRLAALLHDIGHGPFSHVSEYLLEKYHQLPQSSVGEREKIHEKLTVDIISNDSGIAELLKDEQQEDIRLIIEGSSRSDIRRDIVSSDLDADKIDYLSRDSYFTGVKYGIFDIEKIYDSFVYLSQGEQSYLGIDESGIFAIEQLILAKYHMTQQVYAHRVRVITDYMIVRGLKLAIDDGLTEIQELYGYDGSEEYCKQYMQYDDERVTDILVNCDLLRPKSIFRRLRSRHLFKQVFRLPLTERHVTDSIILSLITGLSEDAKQEIETLVASVLECEPWEVIVEVKNVKNPAYQNIGSLDPEEILVNASDGQRKTMQQYDELISVSGRFPSYNTLHVIAPFEVAANDERQLASLKRTGVEEQIRDIVLNYVGG